MGLKQYEGVLKAASDPTRVRILKILESGEICVCQVIARDRERTALARALGPGTICARSMTLPRRKAVCCASQPT